MTRLSVNINKFATLRNARGGNNPNILQTTLDCERFGAQGITVHPRPDERHIRYNDVLLIKDHVKTEFNIEGFPDKRYMELVALAKPTQATLVPDPPNAITSNAGWDTIKNKSFLSEIITQLQSLGIRTSIFVDPVEEMIRGAKEVGTNNVELYTEHYAKNYHIDKNMAVDPYKKTAALAQSLGLGINAGHDLDLENLAFLKKSIPFLDEVSIGHALVCDAIYLGLENTIQLYLRKLEAISE